MSGRALLSRLPRLRALNRIRPMVAMQSRPKMMPMSRRFSRMSPFKMWLNSWPMTPCNWSRDSICDATAGDADGGVAGGVAGGKGIDGRLLVEHIDLRHRHAGGDGHFLDHIEQLALVRVGGVRVHGRPPINVATEPPPPASSLVL